MYNARRDYRHEAYIYDEFIGGVEVSGQAQLGELGWRDSSSGTAGTVSSLTSVLGHPGIARLSTAATALSLQAIMLGPNGTTVLWVDDLWEISFHLRLNTNDTDTQVRIGVGTNANGDPPNGCFFQKLYADTNWTILNQFGAGTPVSTGVAIDTNWHTFKIRRINSTTIGYTFDGNSEITDTANMPNSTGVQPFLQIKTQTTAAKTLDVDFFECRVSGLSRA